MGDECSPVHLRRTSGSAWHPIKDDDIVCSVQKYTVNTRLVRHHEGCEKFVHSQRQDIRNLENDYGIKNRDELPQGALNDMDMTCNAQAFINISRKRLCRCASPETRHAWESAIDYLKEVDPMLASVCVPECIYRGFCPEFDRCCGYVNTEAYKKRLLEYRSIPNKNK